MIAASILAAAAGLLIGWAIGSAASARQLRRRRENQSAQQYAALVRALAPTARTTSGDR